MEMVQASSHLAKDLQLLIFLLLLDAELESPDAVAEFARISLHCLLFEGLSDVWVLRRLDIYVLFIMDNFSEVLFLLQFVKFAVPVFDPVAACYFVATKLRLLATSLLGPSIVLPLDAHSTEDFEGVEAAGRGQRRRLYFHDLATMSCFLTISRTPPQVALSRYQVLFNIVVELSEWHSCAFRLLAPLFRPCLVGYF